MSCGYTDVKSISITVGPREMENIEIIKSFIKRDNRSWAICEAINFYADHIEWKTRDKESNKSDSSLNNSLTNT